MDKESILVSVLLPVYNAAATVRESIDSILAQTLTDFEFIIINDGSTDNSEEIILSYEDERIRYYSNDGNKGLIYTLNRGIELSQGKYIARMDADDIAYPERLEKQIEIMEKSPDIVVCGTRIRGFGNIGEKGFKYVVKESSEEIKRQLVINSSITHPTAVIKRQVLIDYDIRYDKEYLHAEDYRLWVELSKYGSFYNVPEVLLDYRISDTQVSTKWHSTQVETAKRCRRDYISNLYVGSDISDDLEKGIITVRTIRELKRSVYYNEVLETFYMSLARYSIKELSYFIFSFDWLKFKLITNFAIFKRFIRGKNPVI